MTFSKLQIYSIKQKHKKYKRQKQKNKKIQETETKIENQMQRQNQRPKSIDVLRAIVLSYIKYTSPALSLERPRHTQTHTFPLTHMN